MFTITVQNGKHYRIPTQRIPAVDCPYDYFTGPPDDLDTDDDTGVTQGTCNESPGVNIANIYADRDIKIILIP